MSENERTAGGVVGKLAGKAKATAGDVLGREDLAREGRLQEAQSDAEVEAERELADHPAGRRLVVAHGSSTLLVPGFALRATRRPGPGT